MGTGARGAHSRGRRIPAVLVVERTGIGLRAARMAVRVVAAPAGVYSASLLGRPFAFSRRATARRFTAAAVRAHSPLTQQGHFRGSWPGPPHRTGTPAQRGRRGARI